MRRRRWSPSSMKASCASTSPMKIPSALAEAAEPTVFTLYEQQDQPWKRWMYIVIRSNDEPGQLARRVQEQVWAIDKQLPLTSIQLMNDVVAQSVSGQRFNLVLLGLFAA